MNSEVARVLQLYSDPYPASMFHNVIIESYNIINAQREISLSPCVVKISFYPFNAIMYLFAKYDDDGENLDSLSLQIQTILNIESQFLTWDQVYEGGKEVPKLTPYETVKCACLNTHMYDRWFNDFPAGSFKAEHVSENDLLTDITGVSTNAKRCK